MTISQVRAGFSRHLPKDKRRNHSRILRDESGIAKLVPKDYNKSKLIR